MARTYKPAIRKGLETDLETGLLSYFNAGVLIKNGGALLPTSIPVRQVSDIDALVNGIKEIASTLTTNEIIDTLRLLLGNPRAAGVEKLNGRRLNTYVFSLDRAEIPTIRVNNRKGNTLRFAFSEGVVLTGIIYYH